MVDRVQLLKQVLPPRLARWAAAFAAAEAITQVDALLIACICDRESRGGDELLPPGPAGTGDNGHGRGLMQIDDRSWGDWLTLLEADGSPTWANPAKNILFGAQLLQRALHTYRTQMADAGDAVQRICAVASYNCGHGNVHHGLAAVLLPLTADSVLAAVDKRTTGGDYAAAVLAHYSTLTAKLGE